MLPLSYTLHHRILALLASISEKLGEVKAAHLERPAPVLRQAYRVSAVHATVAVDGNPLDPRPVAELIATRPHAFAPTALEVANTNRALDRLPTLEPYLALHLRQAHGELMHNLALDAGQYRTAPVDVFYGEHHAGRQAPATNLPSLVEELLDFVENDEAPLLITSCVLHFGLVYLRPFSAGNARLARLWQRRVLMHRWPVFAFLPVEAFILRAEPAYHAALEYADRQGDCGGFIVYMLERIDEALAELIAAPRTALAAPDRLALFLEEHRPARFTRKDYRRMYPELSTATASRDLAEGVRKRRLELIGIGRTASYKPIGTNG